MDDRAFGVALIVGASALALVVAFFLRTRLPGVVVTGVLSAAGVGLGAGALMVQDDPSAADWWATLIGLAVLVPFHARVMLGPLGPAGGDGGAHGRA